MRRYRVQASTAPVEESPGWTSVSLGPASDVGRDDAQRALTDVLQCDHVVVLTGLGTSLCIRSSTGGLLFPTMSALWNKVSESVGPGVFLEVATAVGADVAGKNIERLLSRCKMAISLGPPAGAADTSPDIVGFVANAEEVIRKECRQTLTEDATATHEDFLRRLTRRAPRRPRVNLFTTNYDLCFETAASRIGLPVVDGFSFSAPAQFQPEVFDYDIVTHSSYSKEPDFVPRLLRLFKLHGSVDWHMDGGIIVKKPDTASPALIYPQFGKYQASYTPPFLEIMSRFQGLLRQRSVGVLSVSCGFNDDHIAEPVLSAVKSNSNLRVVIAAPDLCDLDAKAFFGASSVPATETNSYLRKFDHLIESGDARLTFINGFFPDLVSLMPSLGAKTEAEEHEARIRRLEKAVARLGGGPVSDS